MKFRNAAPAALTLALAAAATTAHAGVYTDDMAKCLVRSTTMADQNTLIAWIYAAISANPNLKAYSRLTESDQQQILKRGGELYERLLTVDCRKESVAAIKYEGASAFQGAFSVLGQVAMRNAMSDPQVAAALDMSKYLDMKKLEELGKEAGVASGK